MPRKRHEGPSFKSNDGRAIKFDYTAKYISTDGGLILFAEEDKHLRCLTRVAKILSAADARQPGKINHPPLEIISIYVYGLISGFVDFNDHAELRNDLEYQILAGKEGVPLASPSTLTRFFNSFDEQTCQKIQDLFLDIFMEQSAQPPQKLVIDCDCTVNKVHGNQEGAAYNGFYKSVCFVPMYFFCGKHLLMPVLYKMKNEEEKVEVEDNVEEKDKNEKEVENLIQKICIEKLSRLVMRLREKWPDVELFFRADAGFWRPEIATWCENHNVTYLIGIAPNKTLDAYVSEVEQATKAEFQIKQDQTIKHADFRYQAKSWDRSRRIVAKVEVNSHRIDKRYIVINNENPYPKQAYEFYSQRGEMENRFKELKNDLSTDRNSLHKFDANYLRFLIAHIPYVIMDYLREFALKKTMLKNATCGTMRLRLVKIATTIETNTRSIYFHLTRSYPYQALFDFVANQVAERILPATCADSSP